MHVKMLLDTSEVLEGPSPPAERFCRSRSDSPPQSARTYSWTELMRRVWSIDVLQCPRCGARMRILAAIHPPGAIRKILDCPGLPFRPPPRLPAHGLSPASELMHVNSQSVAGTMPPTTADIRQGPDPPASQPLLRLHRNPRHHLPRPRRRLAVTRGLAEVRGEAADTSAGNAAFRMAQCPLTLE